MEKLTKEELDKFFKTVKNDNIYVLPKYFMTKGQIEKMVEEGLAPPNILDEMPKDVIITVPVMQEGTDKMGRIWTKEMIEEIEKQTAEWLDKMKSIQGKRAELHPINDACECQTGGFVSFEDFWEE